MSESKEYDPNWWHKEMELSLDRKRAASATSALAKEGDAFLILTEGRVTGPIYFKSLCKLLRLPAVKIQIQSGWASDPRHVINQAADLAEQQKVLHTRGELAADAPASFDHVWAVVDTDVAVREGFWNEVVQLAQAHRVTLAPSTPCIEFWLLLHLCYNTRTDLWDGDSAKRALAAEVKMKLNLDYSTEAKKAKAAIAKLLNHWPEAVRNAGRVRQYHASAGTTEPANPSTEVDRLVRAMNDAALPHNRRHIP